MVTAVTTAIGLIGADAIFSYMGGEPAVQQAAKEYFQVVMIGNIFASFTITINAAQRGVGRTKIAMATNTAANLVNVVFNYFLIEGNFGFPRLGVRGAAIATALGHLVALGLAVHSLCRRGGFLSLRRGGSWRLEKETVGLIARVSSGALMEQAGTRLGMLLYVKIVNGLGTAAFAAHQICMTFTDILFSVGEALGVAASAFTGRYLGAGRPDLSMVYGRIGLRCTVVLSIVTCPLVYVFREGLMRIYSSEADVIALGEDVFVVVALSGVFVIANSLYAGALRGAGDVNFVGVSSLIGFFVVRPVVSYLLCYPAGIGLIGAWIGLAVDYLVRFALYYVRFNRDGGRPSGYKGKELFCSCTNLFWMRSRPAARSGPLPTSPSPGRSWRSWWRPAAGPPRARIASPSALPC